MVEYFRLLGMFTAAVEAVVLDLLFLSDDL